MDETRADSPIWHRPWLHALLLGASAAAFYLNSLENGFVWNDWTLIIKNFLVKDPSHVQEILASPFWKPLTGEPFQSYRPLLFLSYLLDYSLWGTEPWGYHLTNLLLHLSATLLVYGLLGLFLPAVQAFLAALIFGLHPVHVENVSYISGRPDLLMTWFLLAGALLFAASRRYSSPSLYVASLPFFLLALFSKEAALVYPLLLLGLDFAGSVRGETGGRRLLLRFIAPAALAGLYLAARTWGVGLPVLGPGPWGPPAESGVLALKALPLALGLFVFPADLHFLHPLGPVGGVLTAVGLFLLLASAGGAWLGFCRRQPGLLLGLLWLWVGLLPLLWYVSLERALLEGWLYFPSVGLVALLVPALEAGHRRLTRRPAHWLVILLAVLLGAVTVSRNQIWKDSLLLSLDTMAAASHHPTAFRLLGETYFERGRTGRAEELFSEGLIQFPEDPLLHASMGRLQGFLGREAQAQEHYSRFRELRPQEPYPYWVLGRFHQNRGRLEEAQDFLETAVALLPYSSELFNDLALLYYLQGKREQAERALQEALRIAPRSRVLLQNRERVRRGEGPGLMDP